MKQARAMGSVWNGHGLELGFSGEHARTLIIQSTMSGDLPEGFEDCLRVGVAGYTYCSARDADAEETPGARDPPGNYQYKEAPRRRARSSGAKTLRAYPESACMSMIGNFLLVGDQRLDHLLADPAQVHDLCDEGYEAGGEAFVDIDKTWHCLHFLLTGTADGGDPPLNFVLTGGREVGDEDVGYGPARAFSSQEVAQIAKALEPVDRSWLVAKFDASQMDRLEIYPDAGHWSEIDPGSEDLFGYYLGGFESIKTLVRRGASAGLGMLAWLS